MAVTEFYSTYMIDDALMSCGDVITVDCDGLHSYTNICDLLAQCFTTYNYATLPACVESFLNNLDTQQVGYFLRISSSHCLEAIPLSIISTDEKVKVDSTDTTGYLATKIVGCGTVTVSPNGPAGARYLEICSNAPTNFYELDDVPSNYSLCSGVTRPRSTGDQYVVVNSIGNGLSYKCEKKRVGAIYAGANIEINSRLILDNNQDKFFFSSNMNLFEGDAECFYSTTLTTNPSCEGEYSISVLKIPEDGVYRIWLKGNFAVNPGFEAVRMLIKSNIAAHDGCIDCKFGANGNFWGGANVTPLVFPGANTLTQITDVTMVSFFNFGGSIQLYCTKNEIFNFQFRCCTHSGISTIVPRITILNSGLESGTYGGGVGTNLGPRSGVGYGIEFIRKQPFDTSF